MSAIHPTIDATPAGDTVTSTTLLGRVAVIGDEAAGREFVARYTPMVRALGLSSGLAAQDVEDLTQEVMIAAVEALRGHRYDRKVGRFKHWLKGVIYHKISDARANNTRAVGRPLFHRGHENLGCRRGESGCVKALPLPPPEGRGEEEPCHEESSRRGDLPGPGWGQPGSDETPRGLKSAARYGRGTDGRGSVALDELASSVLPPPEEFERRFEGEWRRVAMQEALDVVRREVEPVTFQAFDLYVNQQTPPRDVAKLLGVSRNAVYVAKSRVLTKIKELLDDLDSGDG